MEVIKALGLYQKLALEGVVEPLSCPRHSDDLFGAIYPLTYDFDHETDYVRVICITCNFSFIAGTDTTDYLMKKIEESKNVYARNR